MKKHYLAIILPLLFAINANAQNVITLDPAVTYQTMRGWEVHTFIARPCDPAFPALRDTVINRAVHDIGINRVRLEIRSGTENEIDYYAMWLANGCPNPPDSTYFVWRQNRYATVNDNSDPDSISWDGFHFTHLDWTIENVILPLKAQLAANGESLFINLNYVAFTGQIVGGDYLHDDPDEYAEFVLATQLHLRDKYGLIPDTWEVLLEPDNVPEWDGALLGKAMVAAASRLIEHGFTPKFVAPSNAHMGNAIAYFDRMIGVPGALQYLEEFSYHRYGGRTLENLQAIAERAVQHNLSTAMLEWWFENGTYEVLYQYLTAGRNSAWQGTVLRGMFDINDPDPNNPIVEYTRNTKFNRQYYKFIRSGAVRIDAVSNNSSFAPVAFINSNGAYVVVVNASAAGAFSIAGLAANTYGRKYTTASAYDMDLPDLTIASGESLAAEIPRAGVITIYGKTLPTSVASEEDRTQQIPARFTVYPNPITSEATIQFELPAEGRADLLKLAVYNILGQKVRTLSNMSVLSGMYAVRWNGKDNTGNALPPGLYFVQLKSKQYARTQKVVLTK